MKKLIFFLIFGLMAGVAANAAFRNSNPAPEFHIHANFALFLNGQRFDFGKPEFMDVNPCKIEKTSWITAAYAHDEDEGALEGAVHLHDGNGHLIHVHRAGIQYHDFFESMGMKLSDTQFVDNKGKVYENSKTDSFRFFLNGKEVTSIANTEIHDLDRLLVTYGAKSRSQASINRELIQVENETGKLSGESC